VQPVETAHVPEPGPVETDDRGEPRRVVQHADVIPARPHVGLGPRIPVGGVHCQVVIQGPQLCQTPTAQRCVADLRPRSRRQKRMGQEPAEGKTCTTTTARLLDRSEALGSTLPTSPRPAEQSEDGTQSHKAGPGSGDSLQLSLSQIAAAAPADVAKNSVEGGLTVTCWSSEPPTTYEISMVHSQ
jgi:hypothetical protein